MDATGFQRRYHICLGRPPDNYIDLREDAVVGETIWTINRMAKKGDIALFYLVGPVCAIVARGVLVSDAKRSLDEESGWFGHYMADINELELFEQPITLAAIKSSIPQWRYWHSPMKSHPVPQPFVLPLERLLRTAFV